MILWRKQSPEGARLPSPPLAATLLWVILSLGVPGAWLAGQGRAHRPCDGWTPSTSVLRRGPAVGILFDEGSRDAGWALKVLDPGTGLSEPLVTTEPGRWAGAFVLSPGGTSLAYTGYGDRDAPYWIELADLQSGQVRCLAGPYPRASVESWSPDGVALRFLATDLTSGPVDPEDLLFYHVRWQDGQVELAPHGNLSPDWQKLAPLECRPGSTFVVRWLQRDTQRAFPCMRASYSFAKWSADGRLLGVPMNPVMLVLDSEEGTLRQSDGWQLGQTLRDLDRFVWSPDARSVYFTRSEVRRGDLEINLFALDLATGEEHRLTSGLRVENLTVSPGGTYLALWARPGHRLTEPPGLEGALYVLSLEDLSLMPVLELKDLLTGLKWY